MGRGFGCQNPTAISRRVDSFVPDAFRAGRDFVFRLGSGDHTTDAGGRPCQVVSQIGDGRQGSGRSTKVALALAGRYFRAEAVAIILLMRAGILTGSSARSAVCHQSAIRREPS
jgi:hypothetical protein